MIIAGEPSGDLHGADLVAALQKSDPSIHISGIGGDLMAGQGMRLFHHINHLSVMGVTEVLLQFRRIKRAFNLFRNQLATQKPDLVILIDYPGFNLKAAQTCHYRSIPVLYYVTPKVWAWNHSRIKKMKRFVDHAALIFPFEEALYKKAGIPYTFVGNPLVEQSLRKSSDTPYQRSKIQHPKPKFTVGLLPGSRPAEVKALLPVMLRACKLIEKIKIDPIELDTRDILDTIDIEFLLSLAPSIQNSEVHFSDFKNILTDPDAPKNVEVISGGSELVFNRSDFLIAASGTVTLEAAIRAIPMVIIYKVAPMTAFFARRFLKIPHVGLPNIVSGYEVVPELLQEDAEPEKIAQTVLSIIRSPDMLALMRSRLGMLKGRLGGTDASKRTARISLEMLSRH